MRLLPHGTDPTPRYPAPMCLKVVSYLGQSKKSVLHDSRSIRDFQFVPPLENRGLLPQPRIASSAQAGWPRRRKSESRTSFVSILTHP